MCCTTHAARAIGGVAVSDVETAALDQFPFCKCDTYRCNDGPFRLDYLYRNETLGEFGREEADLVFELHQVRTNAMRTRACACYGD
jgi:hypothetical protein